MEHQIEAALAQLEREINLRDDPVMALADCVGLVLMHWEVLGPAARRELLARMDGTIRELESEARLVSS